MALSMDVLVKTIFFFWFLIKVRGASKRKQSKIKQIQAINEYSACLYVYGSDENQYMVHS